MRFHPAVLGSAWLVFISAYAMALAEREPGFSLAVTLFGALWLDWEFATRPKARGYWLIPLGNIVFGLFGWLNVGLFSGCLFGVALVVLRLEFQNRTSQLSE